MSTPDQLDGPTSIAGEPAAQRPNKPVPELRPSNDTNEALQTTTSRSSKIFAMFQVIVLIGALVASSYAVYTVSKMGESEQRNGVVSNELLVRTEGRDADSVCVQGGSLILIGIDVNLNQYLDGDEVTSTTNLCHGAAGLNGASITGSSGTPSRIETTDLPVGNSTCMAGGISITSGMDENRNEMLDEVEINAVDFLCHGVIGLAGANGLPGSNGAEGNNGAPALVEQRQPLASVCSSGVVIDFGVDNGNGSAVAFDGIMQQDEVVSSLKICSQPLFFGPIDDYNSGMSDGLTDSCDQLIWMPQSTLLLTAGSDGLHGCELWSSDATAGESQMLMDLNPNGDASPGRFAGFTLIATGDVETVIFDADDGVNGRQLWRTDGTINGTQPLIGNVSTAVNSAVKSVVWNEGVVMLNSVDMLLWTNGTAVMSVHEHPTLVQTMSTTDHSIINNLSSYHDDCLFVENGWLWFSAKSEAGIEPYAVHTQGALLAWDLSSGDGDPTAIIDAQGGVVTVAQSDQGRQLVRLNHDGSHLWLTSLVHSGTGNPTDHVGEHLGLHRLGSIIVFDALTSGVDPQVWAHDLEQATTELLSSSILAPGDLAGGLVHQGRLWFDCVAPGIAHEVCSTDGTSTGTITETDLRAGSASALIRGFVATDEVLFVIASGQVNGSETGSCLWALSSTEAPSLLYDPWPGFNNNSNAGTYGSLLISEHHVFFIANDGATGHEWHAFSHGMLTNEWLIWS